MIILRIFLTLLVSVALKCSAGSFPEYQTLRIAVLDGPNLPESTLIWAHYKNNYLSGMEIAKAYAKTKKVKIEYKTFFYGAKPLDILNKISEVKAWNPDAIIGPHYSNDLLLLKKYFKDDIIVVSPYASDPEINKLPKNFYSIFPPDTATANALVNFTSKLQLQNKNVYMVIQADCKECMDLSRSFAKNYHKTLPTAIIDQSTFSEDNFELIDISELMNNFSQHSIIMMFTATYYAYVTISNRISRFISMPSSVFVTHVDNWGDIKLSELLNNSFSFKGYRVTPLFFDSHTQLFRDYNKFYKKLYHSQVSEAVSYMAFSSLISILEAYVSYPINYSLSTRSNVLTNFQKNLSISPNWFRPKKYAVYQAGAFGETIIDEVLCTKS